MKKFLVILMVVAMASVLFVGCTTPPTPDPDPDPEPTPVVVLSSTPVLTSVETSASVSIFSVTSTSTLYMNAAQAGSYILVRGTAPAESVVKIYLDGVLVSTLAETAVTGLWTIAIAESSLGADGVKVLTAKVTEVGLDESLASNAVTFTLDTDAPGIGSIAATASVAGTAVAGTTVSGSVTGTNPLSALALSSTAGVLVVAGDYKIEVLAIETALNNIKITTPAGVSTTYSVAASGVFTDVIPGVTITFKAAWFAGWGVTITNTASSAAATAIAGRAKIVFDEDVSNAGMILGTYAGSVATDPTTYYTATDTGYWTGLTLTAAATATITVYGITDLAGNVGGTAAAPLSASCTIGAASATGDLVP